MKKIIEEKEGEGFEKLLGERITVFCANYIYTGTLSGVNETCLLLTNPSIFRPLLLMVKEGAERRINDSLVYETDSFSEKHWKDAQALPHDWYILINAIESFGVLK